MKMFVPIWCGVVLSILAGKAGAQIDSNSVVSLYCGTVWDSCLASAYCKLCGPSSEMLKDFVNFSESFPLRNLHTIRELGSGFNIDFSDSEITNLSLSDTLLATSARAILEVAFNPIPFRRVDNKFAIKPGKYSYTFAFYADAEVCNLCDASCSESGAGTDSVSLEISSPSEVESKSIPQLFNFVTRYADGIETLEFVPASVSRNLSISNILGITVFETTIRASESGLDLNLSPGCYFARLGDEVAKFVVPPR